MEKPTIENLRMLIYGRELTTRQTADARLEFEKLEAYEANNSISPEEIKLYRKQGFLSAYTSHEMFYKLGAKQFEESYKDKDFTILHDC